MLWYFLRDSGRLDFLIFTCIFRLFQEASTPIICVLHSKCFFEDDGDK